MLGCYDFCGHYEWTFEWLNQLGGESLVREYWDKAIRCDSQVHAAELILKNGFPGMEEYWGHTLEHEGAGYFTASSKDVFRIDMHECRHASSYAVGVKHRKRQHRTLCLQTESTFDLCIHGVRRRHRRVPELPEFAVPDGLAHRRAVLACERFKRGVTALESDGFRPGHEDSRSIRFACHK